MFDMPDLAQNLFPDNNTGRAGSTRGAFDQNPERHSPIDRERP
ncbi:unnamed protein product [Linum tenue]|uniref:Uncharacterized protein n=1 Tax=Linum tenue TaxID=586396 RepID=A0AAV0HRS2_9ROSI|nr:unnamed protein product [Linum tenue]CAI0387981.1 unnamed protein product [Linum tenue]